MATSYREEKPSESTDVVKVSEGPVSQPPPPQPTVTQQRERVYQPPPPTPSPEEKAREKITQLVGQLLTEANELAFDLGDIKLETCKDCPLLARTLHMLKILKELRNVISKMRSP